MLNVNVVFCFVSFSKTIKKTIREWLINSKASNSYLIHDKSILQEKDED